MKREQYDALVKRVEAYAAAHPAAYAMRVVLLAALGYVYAGLMLLVAFAVVAGVSWLTFRASHSQFSPLLMTIAVLGATLLVTAGSCGCAFRRPAESGCALGTGPDWSRWCTCSRPASGRHGCTASSSPPSGTSGWYSGRASGRSDGIAITSCSACH